MDTATTSVMKPPPAIPRLIGRNRFIEASTKELVFTVTSTHPQKRVMNIRNIHFVSTRVAIIPPTSPHFQIFYRKKGSLAPGMSEEVLVLFRPNKFEGFFHDFIRIQT
jgi:hypothetical protein